MQDEISLAILKEINVKLFGEDKQATLKRSTNNPDAYQLYLHGRFYHNKFGSEFRKAISYFEAAIALEPRLCHCVFRDWPPVTSICGFIGIFSPRRVYRR